MALVSVIIPVYKVEKYLHECVNSVLAQDYPELEIILVDDGSPDNCPVLCDELAEKHENIRVVHKQNGGLGSARNSGMEAAQGKYICFVDSDDCLDGRSAVSVMVECAEKKNADITVGCFRRFSENGISDINEHHLQAGDYTRTVDFRFKGFYMYGHLAYNWGKLYRKSFLDKYELPCQLYPFTQDKAHNIRCYSYEPVYAFVQESVYLYRQNEESVTYKYKTNLMPVWIAIAEDYEAFLKERNIEDDYGDLMCFHIFFGSFFLAKQELQAKKKGIREASKALKQYGNNPFVKQSMKTLAKGKYLNEIDVMSWKIVIRGASLLFSMRGYFPLAVGIALLRKVGVDSKITKSRYKKKSGLEEKKQVFSEEEKYLLLLLREELTGKKEEKQIEEEMDVQKVIELAKKHSVISLLYEVLQENSFFNGQLDYVKKESQKTAVQSYRLLFLTKYLVEQFAEAEIPAVVLKGAATGNLYPAPELRKSGDVDLLIPETIEKSKVSSLMEQAGFLKSKDQHANHHVVYKSQEGISIEIHTMPAEPFAYKKVNQSMERFKKECWKHCEQQNVMGVELPVLNKPYHAYELLLHMLQHFMYAGFGLKLLCDWVFLWKQSWSEQEKEQFKELVEDGGLEIFSEALTAVCIKYLGLKTEEYAWEITREDAADAVLREILDAEDFGNADANRMVMMSGTGITAYIREFHHQMHLNFPKAGKVFLLWPVLWVMTLIKFLQNNHKVRRTSAKKVMQEAKRRSSLMDNLKLLR